MDHTINNIRALIVELSDVSLQRKLWLNENNDTGLISSYDELMCSLFDDFNFDYFIDNLAPRINLSNSIIYELNNLREILNGYNSKSSDKEILDDPNWMSVVEQAKSVVQEWNKM